MKKIFDSSEPYESSDTNKNYKRTHSFSKIKSFQKKEKKIAFWTKILIQNKREIGT